MFTNIQQVYNLHKIIVTLSFIIFIYILFNIPKSEENKGVYGLLLIYSLVALYRSVCMTNETENLCLINSKLCQPVINRTLATLAEIGIGFFTIIVISKIFSVNIPIFLGTIIIVAQILCWVGVITNNPKFNALEESLWVIFFSIILGYIIFSNYVGIHKIIISLCIVGYLIFMIVVDIPHYLTVKSQTNQSFLKCSYSDNVNDWKYVVIWQGLYFTLAVLFFTYLFKIN